MEETTIGALVAALAKARADFKPVKKESENPYFKSTYADLATLIEATHEGLSKNELVVIQSPGRLSETNRIEITTILAHSSGQSLSYVLEMPVSKADAQGLGSAITYGRRYAYQAILNVAGDVDDDGNAAVGRTQKDRHSSSTDMSTKDGRTVNPAQVRAFWSAVKEGGKTPDQVHAKFKEYGWEGSEDILKTELVNLMRWAAGPQIPPADLTSQLEQSVDMVEGRKAMKSLFAKANSLGISEEDVKSFAYKKHKVRSMTQLTPEQIRDVEKEVVTWGEKETV